MYNYAEVKSLKLATTSIKGKDYVDVAERVRAFREACPCGSIRTEFVELDAEWCVMRAEVYDDEGKLLGTGTAFETKQASYINKTSYVENCETSAVGRALGMLGIGIDTAICSKDELEHAVDTQDHLKETEKPINATQVNVLTATLKALGVSAEDEQKLKDKYGISDYKQLTFGQYGTILNQLRKRLED